MKTLETMRFKFAEKKFLPPRGQELKGENCIKWKSSEEMQITIILGMELHCDVYIKIDAHNFRPHGIWGSILNKDRAKWVIFVYILFKTRKVINMIIFKMLIQMTNGLPRRAIGFKGVQWKMHYYFYTHLVKF